MGMMASQITSLTIINSTIYLGADQGKHQSSASLAFVRRIHRWPVNSPHKGPVTWKMFPFEHAIMYWQVGPFFIFLLHLYNTLRGLKFRIECTCPLGKWIVKITCPNVPFTCLKEIKPMQLMSKSEICSRPSDKSCRYSTCPTVIFTNLRRSDEWNFEPCPFD